MDFYNEEIIESLYNSDFFVDMESSTKYNELRHQYNKLFDSIENKDLKIKLTEINELKNEMDSESDKEIFKKGFSIGVKLIIEALSTK